MADLSGSDRERELRKQRLRENVIEGNSKTGEGDRRPSPVVFLTSLICIALFGFGIYYYIEHSISYEYNISWTRDLDLSENTAINGSEYVAFDGGIIKYSSDGAEYIDREGNSIWERSYQLADPIVDANDNYAVIADQGSTRFYIFNSAGLIAQSDTVHALSRVVIADNGVVYAILNDTDADYITAYRSDGSALDLSVRSVISGEGYPFDIDVSPDGTQILTSYVTVENEQIINNVVFRNFGEVGANAGASRVVGGFRDEFEGHLTGRVHFSTDEYSQAFYDGGIVFFSTRVLNSPEVLENIAFEQEILYLDYNDRIEAVLLEGSEGQNTLRIFSSDGAGLAEIQVDAALDKMCVSGSRVIIYSQNQIYVYGRNGNLHADISVDTGDVEEIIASGTNRAFYIVNSDSISRVTL